MPGKATADYLTGSVASDSKKSAPNTGPAEYLRDVFGLVGAVAVVTGGTSGLGSAAASALALAGAEVVVVGRRHARGEAVVEGIADAGGRAVLETADIADPEQIEDLARRVAERHPRVDILVNAAGIFNDGPSSDISLADWDAVMRTNLTGTFLMCQAVGRGMIERRRGKIVNFASTDAFVGIPGQLAYCVSKAGVVELTKTLGVEWIKSGVNVNAVAPTEFETPMVEAMLDDDGYKNWVAEAIPIGRIGEPSELAGAILYLCSAASDMVVGHTLLVDGGRTAI